MVVDGREICLRYHSKVECVRHCLCSQAPLRGGIRGNLIRCIGNFRAAHKPYIKKIFNGGGNWGSCGGQSNCKSNRGNSKIRKKPDRQTHGSGAGCGFGRGVNVGGRIQD